MICKKCGKEKEEAFFMDRNGLSNICNDCKPKVATKEVVVPVVSNKPISKKSTKKS